MSDVHELLGRQIAAEMIGADAKSGGFDWSTLINAAAEASNQGINYVQTQKAQDASNAAQDDKVKKAASADSAWADAETTLDITKQGGDASKIAAAQSLASAMQSAAVSTAAGLDSDHAAKRLANAQKQANSASQSALSNSSNTAAQAKMRAWQKVLAAVASSGGSSSSPDAALLTQHGMSRGGSGENFFTQKVGGIPVWGLMAGGGVVLTGLILMLRRRK